MNRSMKIRAIIFTFIPMTLFGFYSGISRQFHLEDQGAMQAIAGACVLSLAALAGIQRLLRDRHYFPPAILILMTLHALPLFLIPGGDYRSVMESGGAAGLIYGKPQFILYLWLFLMTILLPLFGVRPFVEYFGRLMTPEPFHGTELFRAVNLRLNYFWAILFALSAGSQFLPWRLLQNFLPLVIQIGIGIPATRLLVPFFQAQLSHLEKGRVRDYIKTAHDALSGMPFVFNREAAKGISLIIQFHMTGEEEFQGWLEVKDGKCAYHEGLHEKPGLLIRSDSGTWLKIARGELKGHEALIKGMYTAEGNLSNLTLFSRLFSASGKKDAGSQKNDGAPATEKLFFMSHEYGSVEPRSIKKVLVLQGSPRGKGVSKTEILTEAFASGCREAGAAVETVNLREMKISHCTGCYTCWTRTPGVCIFRDDAAAIMDKQMDADLVVYATPLYHFGIMSILKKYMERTLPMLEPFLVSGKNGTTSHPLRWNRAPANAVIISVCGFPEAGHFEALSKNFHLMEKSGNGMRILGELYRPASEILNNPFFSDENSRVLAAAEKAGSGLVMNGYMEKSLMSEIARVGTDRDEFMKDANLTWEQCIEKKKTLPEMQREFAAANAVS